MSDYRIIPLTQARGWPSAAPVLEHLLSGSVYPWVQVGGEAEASHLRMQEGSPS